MSVPHSSGRSALHRSGGPSDTKLPSRRSGCLRTKCGTSPLVRDALPGGPTADASPGPRVSELLVGRSTGGFCEVRGQRRPAVRPARRAGRTLIIPLAEHAGYLQSRFRKKQGTGLSGRPARSESGPNSNHPACGASGVLSPLDTVRAVSGGSQLPAFASWTRRPGPAAVTAHASPA